MLRSQNTIREMNHKGYTAIFDIDSLVYQACYSAEDLEEAIEGFFNRYDHALYCLGNHVKIEKVIPVGFCTNNYRKKVDLSYKAHRPSRDERPSFFDDLIDHIKDNMNVQIRSGIETDDLVAKFYEYYGKDETIIVSIDKDYRQFECNLYNYAKDTLEKITGYEAYYNFMEQMVIGDRADNVKPLKGYGPKWCDKNLAGKSDWGILRAVYSLYKAKYRSKAKEVYMRTYLLLKLNVF